MPLVCDVPVDDLAHVRAGVRRVLASELDDYRDHGFLPVRNHFARWSYFHLVVRAGTTPLARARS